MFAIWGYEDMASFLNFPTWPWQVATDTRDGAEGTPQQAILPTDFPAFGLKTPLEPFEVVECGSARMSGHPQ